MYEEKNIFMSYIQNVTHCARLSSLHAHTHSWMLLLVKTIQYTLTHYHTFNGYVTELYKEIRWPLQVFQSAAILEVL